MVPLGNSTLVPNRWNVLKQSHSVSGSIADPRVLIESWVGFMFATDLDVRYWHKADIPPALTNVRYRG